MSDEIDKVQSNNLLPFEQDKKDRLANVGNAAPREVDDIGIELVYWMSDFRNLWNTEYPRAAEDMNDSHWESWYKNFSVFTRQDIEYGFNEIRKKQRDFPPNLSHLYNFVQNNAQKRIRVEDVGKEDKRCADLETGKCIYGDAYWKLNKYGSHDFVVKCINIGCDNDIKGYPNEFEKRQKPSPQSKGEWFKLCADFMSNSDDIKIGESDKTPRDRKFETYQWAELFPDGHIGEVLKEYNLDENLSFTEQCIAISNLPKRRNVGGDVL